MHDLRKTNDHMEIKTRK